MNSATDTAYTAPRSNQSTVNMALGDQSSAVEGDADQMCSN
jgi:hypothetical protein